MVKKDTQAMVGKYAYMIGLLLAIIAGLVVSVAGYAYTPLILVILGLLVGLINIAEKNVLTLLVGILAIVIVGNATLEVIPTIGTYLVSILNNVILFAGAAAFVVALKAILQVTKE